MNRFGLSEMGQRMSAPPISWLMKLALGRPQLISLAVGFTDNESLPVEEAKELLADILSSSKSGQSALQYGTTAGLPSLRSVTTARLKKLDGAPAKAEFYDPERVLITNGSQQLLYLVTECLCDPGDIVLVEDPTYFVYLGIAQSRGLQCLGVKLGRDGLDLEHLEQRLEMLKRSGELPRLKMLYAVTYFQNPSGVSTCLEKKKAMLRLLRRYEPAAGHRIYLLEDAAYRELGFASHRAGIPSALSVSQYANRVIYAGTYSKPFATGARVGFGLLPEPVYTCALRAKGNHDFGSANLLQRLLERALSGGEYDRHLRVLQSRYERKARLMEAAMRRSPLSSAEWAQPEGGLYLWVALPGRLPCGTRSKLFKRALANDVLYVPGQLCYAEDPSRRAPDHEMRLSFGGAPEEHLRLGIERLGQVVRELA